MIKPGLTQGTETRKVNQTAERVVKVEATGAHQFQTAKDAEVEQLKRNQRTAVRVERMAALRAAVPGWVKANLGLRGREAREVEKALIKEVQKQPALLETEIESPNYSKAALGESEVSADSNQGAVAAVRPLQISLTATKLLVQPGTICNYLPTAFGAGVPLELTKPTVDAVVYVRVTVTAPTSGIGYPSVAQADIAVLVGTSLPANSTPNFYYQFGAFNATTGLVVNTAYGPIDGHPYRNWFTTPPTAGLVLFGSDV